MILSLHLKIDSSLLQEFPGLRAYLVRIFEVNIASSSAKVQILGSLVSEVTTSILQKYDLEKLKDIPIFRTYRDFFWLVGIDPTKTRPAAEALTRRILSGKPFPRINILVDAYNLASVVSGVPIAAFDLDKVKGDLLMRRARAGETFLGIGMKQAETLKGAEVVVSDEEKLIAIYPYRDSANSKVTEDTKNILLMVCGVPGVEEKELEQAQIVTVDYVTRFCGGTQAYGYR
jgi:DNA/RNA-binding domain of Phe-tRNA-synthetase-like protein